jgi:heavy metal sensor kinase
LESKWSFKADALDIENDYIDIIDRNGKVVANSGNFPKNLLPVLPRDIKKIVPFEKKFQDVKFEKNNIRMITMPYLYNKEIFIIQVATSLSMVIEMLRERLTYIAASIPIILLLTSMIGRFLTGEILTPVKKISLMAKNITSEDLSKRVEIGPKDDEMNYLISTFNDMIQRLEKSFKHISEFTSHVSHELKTPLTIMRGESELALKKERNPEEYTRVLHGNLEEISRMLKIVEDLLFLSRLENSSTVFKFEKFDITEFLQDICKNCRILASTKHIKINYAFLDSPIFINGDKAHLRRLFYNLLNNSIKFTPENGTISVEASYKEHKTFIYVKDTGVGIEKENIGKIFDKCFHTENSVLNTTPGTGLGLNISLMIAKAHNGSISVESKIDQGSTFTVLLPSA